MNETTQVQMRLKDLHQDMERYLEEDCYCPGEIYDVSGFFFLVFKGEEECKYVGEGPSKNEERPSIIKCVICRNQLLNFWIDTNQDKIYEAERYDATENNIQFIKDWFSGQDMEGRGIDEFEKGSTVKALQDVLSYADAIIVS